MDADAHRLTLLTELVERRHRGLQFLAMLPDRSLVIGGLTLKA